jgi:hypothetical protein
VVYVQPVSLRAAAMALAKMLFVLLLVEASALNEPHAPTSNTTSIEEAAVPRIHPLPGFTVSSTRVIYESVIVANSILYRSTVQSSRSFNRQWR